MPQHWLSRKLWSCPRLAPRQFVGRPICDAPPSPCVLQPTTGPVTLFDICSGVQCSDACQSCQSATGTCGLDPYKVSCPGAAIACYYARCSLPQLPLPQQPAPALGSCLSTRPLPYPHCSCAAGGCRLLLRKLPLQRSMPLLHPRQRLRPGSRQVHCEPSTPRHRCAGGPAPYRASSHHLHNRPAAAQHCAPRGDGTASRANQPAAHGDPASSCHYPAAGDGAPGDSAPGDSAPGDQPALCWKHPTAAHQPP